MAGRRATLTSACCGCVERDRSTSWGRLDREIQALTAACNRLRLGQRPGTEAGVIGTRITTEGAYREPQVKRPPGSHRELGMMWPRQHPAFQLMLTP